VPPKLPAHHTQTLQNTFQNTSPTQLKTGQNQKQKTTQTLPIKTRKKRNNHKIRRKPTKNNPEDSNKHYTQQKHKHHPNHKKTTRSFDILHQFSQG
jgi:hypothetical protein